MAFTVPNAAAAAFGPQASLDSGDLTVMAAGSALTGVSTGCVVAAQGTPNMTVSVAGGVVLLSGRRVPVTAGNVTITTANASNPRHDLITVDSAGALAAVPGTPGPVTVTSEPTFPAVPAGRVVLAAIYVPAAATSIATAQILDKRVFIVDPRIAGASCGFALGSGLPSLSTAELAQRLDGIQALGCGWVRFDFDWSAIQSVNSSTYDWSATDRIAAALQARGINAVGVLTYTPAWARAAGTNSHYPPTNAGVFGGFCQAAALRYASYGIKTWEVWNEPNVATFWQPAASASAYAALLQSAYNNIKAGNNNALVLSGGMSPASTTGGDIAPLDFLTGLYSASAGHKGHYFDALAYHPYTSPVTVAYDQWDNAWGDLSAVRAVMVSNGEAGKRIWLTEYGAPTGGPGGAADVNAYTGDTHVTERMQALTVTDLFEACRRYDYLGPVFWYSYIDAGTTTDTNENFFGILRADYSMKPAFYAFEAAVGVYH